jgi:hypothetical protein
MRHRTLVLSLTINCEQDCGDLLVYDRVYNVSPTVFLLLPKSYRLLGLPQAVCIGCMTSYLD